MIKAIVKRLIPFYSSYIKSASSSIHNQSYFNYVKFRITGICNRGGVLSSTSDMYHCKSKKNICGV